MSGRLEGKVALISGIARGQGRAHALRLAQEGADIVGFDACGPIEAQGAPASSPADMAETVALVEDLDRRIVSAQADVRDADAVATFVDGAVAELGRLDIVCANAGINGVAGTVAETALSDWKAVMDTNLTGVFNTVKTAIPYLASSGRGGSIIITSSSIGLRSVPNMSSYGTAKAGLIGLMRTLALELAEHHIRVNSVHPTSVATPLALNELTFKLFRPDLENPTIDDARDTFQALNALPVPWIEPVDVSNAVLFLASDEARYITGVALPVDAGFAIG